jgi:septum formation protein
MRKATAVAELLPADTIVLGCDSLVEHDGVVLGKPASASDARAWWQRFRGTDVTVWTGQYLARGTRGFMSFGSATVRFATVTDDEIDRYVATGEALGAAGGFRLDGRASAFIESIEGDPGIVHGVSVCHLATALYELDVEVADLWV